MRSAVATVAIAVLLGAAVGYLVSLRQGGASEVRGNLRLARPTVAGDDAARVEPPPAVDARDDRPPDAALDSSALAVSDDGDDDSARSPALAKNRDAVRLAAAGDFTAAAALLREAQTLEPANQLIRTNLQAVLINRGFEDVAAERFDAAVGRFVEALAISDRPEIRRGLGYAYYRLGNLDLARASLERAVEQEGGDAVTYVTLGRIYIERREQPRALEMLERGLAAGADAPGLAATVERLRRDADAEKDYAALASSHFVLKFDGRENTTAGRLVLNALEDAYRKVGARFAYYPLERLEVILYPDETFRDLTSSPHWSGAVFDGRIKLPIGGLERGTERLTRTLRHEYAHAAIVTLSRGRAPVWLNEGLAQVAEESEDEGRTNRIRMAIGSGELLSLHDLENGFTRFDREHASLAYAQAYFAARYLVEKKGSYNVRRLLEAMATAESTDAAFRQALSLPYADFEQRVVADLQRQIG